MICYITAKPNANKATPASLIRIYESISIYNTTKWRIYYTKLQLIIICLISFPFIWIRIFFCTIWKEEEEKKSMQIRGCKLPFNKNQQQRKKGGEEKSFTHKSVWQKIEFGFSIQILCSVLSIRSVYYYVSEINPQPLEQLNKSKCSTEQIFFCVIF